MAIRFLFFILIFSPGLLIAQVSNDDCSNAHALDDLDSWCSEVAAFTTIDATFSGEVLPSCFEATPTPLDVWFEFTAIAPNISVSANGDLRVNSGGTIIDPNVALYGGDCDDLEIINCQEGLPGISQAGFFSTALTVGEVYYIRVSSAVSTGTLQLCVNNFAEIPKSSSDCEPGVILCDKSAFSTELVTGEGENPNELSVVGCHDLTCNVAEYRSTWYKWVCDEPGTLEFTISPLNPSDDLDFVLVELPNGIDDCSGMFDLRCMASGENVGSPLEEWVACTGPTGISVSDTDTGESCGCQDGNNNFLEAIVMESGKAYAIVISNLSQSESGFSMDFGGTGTFLGPSVDFDFSLEGDICAGEKILYSDASSFVGNIVSWNWSFGADANPQTATGLGPHEVTYSSEGEKSALLRIETEMGCYSSIQKKTATIGAAIPLGDFEIPNVFTPNNDGLNDEFKVYASEEFIQEVGSYNIQVFNRWGNIVFESDQISQVWSGAYKDAPSASDVYTYRIQLVYPCDEEVSVMIGEVTLLR